MKSLLKARVDLSAAKGRLAELAALDEPTDGQRLEMRQAEGDLPTLEEAYRAALMAAEDDGDGETGDGESAEMRSLQARATLAGAIGSILQGGALQGAEAELARARGIVGAGLPLDLLQTRAAATVTGTPQYNQAPVLQALFPSPVAGFTGTARPTVPVGHRSVPRISTSATVGTPSKGSAVTESTVALTIASATPSRVAASIRFAVEDLAVVQGMEEALRANAGAAITSALDGLVIDALGSTSADADPTAATTTVTMESWRQLLADAIDGTLATDLTGIRAVVNLDTIRRLESLDHASATEPFSAAAWTRRETGGLLATEHAKATASNDAEVSLIRGMRTDCVEQPIWPSVAIERVNDASASGQIVLVFTVLAAVLIHRSAAFARESVQLA